MRKADLNLLVIFDTIMREGSMTRAAEQLAMTQPAVSNAVARMRLTWNDPLFTKQRRGIVPTPTSRRCGNKSAPPCSSLRNGEYRAVRQRRCPPTPACIFPHEIHCNHKQSGR